MFNRGGTKIVRQGYENASQTGPYGVWKSGDQFTTETDTGALSADEQIKQRHLDRFHEDRLARLPWDYKREVFNQTFPLIRDQIGGQSDASATFGRVGGENTAQPALPNSFVFSPQQTQQRVNAARAMADQGAASQSRQVGEGMTARGFGSRSPALLALQQGASMAGRMQGADQEREIRRGDAQMNANQDLGVGQLAQQAWNAWQQNDIARRQTQVEAALGQSRNMVSLIQALTGLA